MQRVILTAAAVMLLGAGVASIAKADMNIGAVNENGKCYQKAIGGHDLGYGYWTDCPKRAAAAPVAHHRHAKRGDQSEK